MSIMMFQNREGLAVALASGEIRSITGEINHKGNEDQISIITLKDSKAIMEAKVTFLDLVNTWQMALEGVN